MSCGSLGQLLGISCWVVTDVRWVKVGSSLHNYHGCSEGGMIIIDAQKEVDLHKVYFTKPPLIVSLFSSENPLNLCSPLAQSNLRYCKVHRNIELL